MERHNKFIKDIQGKEEKPIDTEGLWRLITSLSGKEAQELIASLDDKTVTALRASKNPYRKPIYLKGKNKILAFYFTNVSERFCERLAMTSLIGFIYRMLDEYEPENPSGLLSENEPKFAMPFNQKIKELKRRQPEINLVKELEELHSSLASQKQEKRELQKIARQICITKIKIYKYRMRYTREDLEYLDGVIKSLEYEVSSSEFRVEAIKKDLVRLPEEKEEKARHHAEFKEGKVSNPNPKWLPRVSDYDIQIKNNESLLEKELEKQAGLRDDLASRVKQKENYEAFLAAQQEGIDAVRADYNKRGGKLNINPDIEEYKPTEEEYDLLAEEVKKELGITQTYEEYVTSQQIIIETFLNKYFCFNPDDHMRSVYKAGADPTRIPLSATREEDLAQKKYERTVIPPDDTFFRWRRYTEANYEELRETCIDIYPEKPDLECAIAPLEAFEGRTPEEAQAKFETFKNRYAKEAETEIYGASFGDWSLLGPWQGNREKISFYQKESEILKRIVDKHKEDARAGAGLMKKRAQDKRAQNEKEAGPLDPALQDYRKSIKPNAALETHGGKHIDEIQAHQVPRDEQESTNNEVEVGVHVIKPLMRRRRLRGETEQWKFHIPAEKPAEGSAQLYNPKEFQKNVNLEDFSV